MIAIVPCGLTASMPTGLNVRAGYRRMSRPTTVRGELYESRLAANLRKLVTYQSGGSMNAWCARHQLTQSTYQKIATGQRGATVAMLERIEDATGYAAWQLLHPDFDPRMMPPMLDAHAMRVAAIFAGIKDPLGRQKAEAVIEQLTDEPLPPRVDEAPASDARRTTRAPRPAP